MVKFETSFIPPVSGDSLSREMTLGRAVEQLLPDAIEGQTFMLAQREYERVLVAHDNEDILGIQLLDYDEYESAVRLGSQIISEAVGSPDAQERFGYEFKQRALGRWEDLV